MLQKIKNIVLGRNAAWNRTFGNYFTYLQEGNNRLIARIGKDPITEMFDERKQNYPQEHTSCLFVSKVVLALNRFLLWTTSEALIFIVLGKNNSPLLNMRLREVPTHTTRNLVLGTATGYAFCATVPQNYQTIRKLLLMTLAKLAVDSSEIQFHINTFSSATHAKYFDIMADNILIDLNRRNDIPAFAALISYFGETAVRVREFADHLMSADKDELEKFLTIE